MELHSLTAISPVDGRYRQGLEALSEYASEFALIRYRTLVETEWLIELANTEGFDLLQAFSNDQCETLRAIYRTFSLEDAQKVRTKEAQTNHDVKAVEYFVKEKVAAMGLNTAIELVHFGCTSEDINNLAYGLMLKDVHQKLVLPQMDTIITSLSDFARPLTNVSMLSRTHGQTASPTSVGKEIVNFASRLQKCRNEIADALILGKMNGAVGNFNAHVAVCPHLDWIVLSKEFILRLGLCPNELTTQIEPHDYMAHIFHAMVRFNQVLLDFNRDMWGYISLGYFRARAVPSETGSSTMPHKVNPIDFENSEGNIGLADAILSHLARKLTVSRWQRDLSDSTALRNVGVGLGHSLIAYSSTIKGISKLEIDRDRIASDLSESWEVLTEAVQIIMRAYGIESGYERVKELTRGLKLDQNLYLELIDKLNLPVEAAGKLRILTPEKYVGLAPKIAEKWLDNANKSV